MSSLKLNAKRSLVAFAMITLFTACGGSQTSTDPNAGTTTGGLTPNYNPAPYPTYSPNPNPSPTSGPGNLSAPLGPFNLSITGAGGAYPTSSTGGIATTDNMLQIRITAAQGSQVAIPGYSNFQAAYGCVKYTVTAMGVAISTQTLAVAGGDNSFCPSAPNSQILDFRGYLSHGSANNINVGITSATNDFYCQEYRYYCEQYDYYNYYYTGSCNNPVMPGPSSYYCPLHTLYRSHVVNATVEVRTDSTSNFQ